MDISTVKSHITNKEPQKMYIFTGPEIAVMDIYIKKLAEVAGLETKRANSVAGISKQLQNKSFLQSMDFCYIIRDDKEYMANEKAWDEIELALNNGNNMLIMLSNSLDKRSKFYKRYKTTICEFEPLNEAILKRYIQKDINLSDKNCEKLIELCESDYSRILLEIDKIKAFQDEEQNNWNDIYDYDMAFEELLYQGVIYQPPKDAIFDFVDAFCKGQSKKSFDLLQQSYAVGESPIVLLSVLYSNIKQMLQVQSCQSKDISKTTGLTGWQIKCAKEKLGYFSNADLVRALKIIRNTEKNIKQGLIEQELAVEYIMVNIL